MNVFSNKKAQGLPITTIIIAILAVLVLVIMFAIFTGRITLFGRALDVCPGVCITETGKGCEELTQKQLPGKYAQPGQNLAVSAKDLKICEACCVSIS